MDVRQPAEFVLAAAVDCILVAFLHRLSDCTTCAISTDGDFIEGANGRHLRRRALRDNRIADMFSQISPQKNK